MTVTASAIEGVLIIPCIQTPPDALQTSQQGHWDGFRFIMEETGPSTEADSEGFGPRFVSGDKVAAGSQGQLDRGW